MRSGIAPRPTAPAERHGDRDTAQDEGRRDQQRQHRHLHLVGLDLLAEIFRRASDHEAGHEHGDDDEQQHAEQARARPADDDLVEHHVGHQHDAGQRHEAVVHGVDGAVRRGGRHDREQRGLGRSEADLLAFHVAAGLVGAGRLVDAQ